MSKDLRYSKKDRDAADGEDMVSKNSERALNIYEHKANAAKRSYLQRDRNHRRQSADLQ